jgi:NAD(P)-dependent dehydrogenase (short-subunit alcohol dehydrogenase family)
MALNPKLAGWRGKRAWVVGASSGIGRALALELLALGATVFMSGRNAQALGTLATQHAGAIALPLDVVDRMQVQGAAQQVIAQGPLDLMVYCAGHYRAMRAAEFDLGEMLRHQQVNYVGVLHVLDGLLPALLRQAQGHVSLVSSVAGYRGLPMSLAYGPTKAALINLAETLYMDLHPAGVGVSLINPGFVETPMTAQNAFHMPALMTPEDAAREILRGWKRGSFEIHFPRRFSLVMKSLSLLPFGAYQALVRRGTGL